MGKNSFNESDLRQLGLTPDRNGVWSKIAPPAKGNQVKTAIKLESVKRGRPGKEETPIFDKMEQGNGWCRIILHGLTKGLNGSSGLMNQHWAVSRIEKKRWLERIGKLQAPEFTGRVKITYIRHCTRFLDWDNFGSSGKFLFDGLKNNKIIEDDSPEYFVEFIPKQVKSRLKDQHIEILIEAI